MTPPKLHVTATSQFPGTEHEPVRQLRTCHQKDHDLVCPQELAHRRFLRWLSQTGKGSKA